MAGAGAAASLLAGYGPEAIAAQGATPSPAAGNPFGEAQKQGGTYTLAGLDSAGRPRDFVPTSYYGTTMFIICKLLYTPLVTLDAKWQNLGPALATEWEWSADNLQLTMKLRDGVTFHDGKPFTANDVVFTYKLMVRNDPFPAVRDVTLIKGAAEYKDGSSDELSGVEAVDDHTVRFTLTSPSNVFLLNLSNCGILPAHAFADDALKAGNTIDTQPFFNFVSGTTPIGTGPWKVKDYKPDTHLELEANKDYYKGAPILDGITILFGVTGPAGVSGIQSSQFDGLYVNADYQTAQALKDNPQINLPAFSDLATEQVLIMATEKPYLSVPVRQALVTALDIETLVKTVNFGYGKPAPSVVMYPALFPNPDLPKYDYDPDKAKQLLAEGGWKADQKLKFGQFVAEGTPSNIIAAMIEMWKAVGVQAEFTPLDPANQVKISQNEDHPYDVVYTSFAWLAYDPSSSYAAFACEKRPDYSNYCNDEYDSTMKEAIRTLDQEKSVALYQKAQVILQQELPYAPLWIAPVVWAINKKVHGGVFGRGPINDIQSELWWKE
jgi:peptide/nickel transport system substrate-binding protein